MEKANSKSKEWKVEMPWGQLAAVSWGKPEDQPILMVHGYMDTAATFYPLLALLPKNYYYVAIDLPGHGLSDPFPDGPLISNVHMVEVIRRFVEHMKWEQFIFIGHSMAHLIGAFYNYIYPGKINRIVYLDPLPPLSLQYYNSFQEQWYKYLYHDYYSNYKRWQEEKYKLIKLERAVNIISMKRQLDEEQAEEVLSRSIIPVDGEKVKLSWDPKMKKISSTPIGADTLYEIFAQNPTPVLNIISTEQNLNGEEIKFGRKLMRKFQETIENFKILYVDGGHDAHITESGKIAEYITLFLNSDYKSVTGNTRSKL